MDETSLREAVVELLHGRGAHVPLDKALAGLPAAARTRRVEGFAHSIWELTEHLRIAQEDILRYTLEPGWVSPEWPAGYWPEGEAAAVDDVRWEASLAALRHDLAALVALVRDPAVDLTARLPHGREGHTVLREALLVADHNAYHAAQIVDLRRAMGAWS